MERSLQRSSSLQLSLVWLYGLALLFCGASDSWCQDSQGPQTTPSGQYSKMTPEQLRQVISDKDKLLAEWIARGQQWQADKATLRQDLATLQETSNKQTVMIEDLMTSLHDQKQVSADQLASRDKLIKDQDAVIEARTAERDGYKNDLDREKALGWIEKIIYSLAGGGLGYVAGHSTK